MSGDFHPRDCGHVIFIVLLLSELRFSLLTGIMEGRRVSLLPPLIFSTDTGDFQPTLVMEGKIFFRG